MPSTSYSVRRLKKASQLRALSARRLEEAYALLLRILRTRNYLTVKARDACRVGECDVATLTTLGTLLSLLARLGYAERLNNSPPVRYRLKPTWMWERVKLICSLNCERGDVLCGLYGQCPYHALVKALGGEGGE
jgi:hypothetical protein